MEAALSRIGEPEEPHGHSELLPHHAMPYYWIFGLLMVLTVVTVIVGVFLRFENELFNVCLALLIAFVKATFVARFFMHLKFEGKLIRLILIGPLTLCVIMICALIPDIGRGRNVSINDPIAMFESTVPSQHEVPNPAGEHDAK